MYHQLNKIIFLWVCSLFCSLFAVAQTEYIVTVNPTTGLFTKIDSIPGIVWLVSYSTYNETKKEYTVHGTLQPGQAPTYLYTLDAVTGSIKTKPLVPYNKFIAIQYSTSTGILYGLVIENGVYYLARIDKVLGTYTLIHDIPGIDGAGEFIIDEANQRMIISAVDHNPAYGLWSIDLVTGNTVYHVSTKPLSDLRYDKTAHKIYGLTNRPGPNPGSNSIISICSIEPTNGAVSVIADLPGVTGIASGHGTFNENDHLFLFTGIEQAPPVLLYSVDVNTGNIISKPPIPTSGNIDHDNLIFFRYDNNSRKLYGLFWEAKTIKAPPPVIDSSCKINLETKIYPSPTSNILIVNKNPTICKVAMNVYNMIGQLVIRDRVILDGHNEIQLANLSAGIYYYSFYSNGNSLLSGRIVKR